MTFDPDHGAAPAAAPSLWRRAWDRVRAFRPSMPRGTTPGGRRSVWGWAWRAALVIVVLYYPVGALVVEDIDDDSAVRTAQRDARRKPGGGGRGRPGRPRGQRPHLDADAAVLHAVGAARQHAELPARHHGGARPLQHRADGPARPHPRLEPDRPRPRAGARLPERAAQHLGLAAQRVADAVGHVGAEVPRRAREAAGLQQAPGARARRSSSAAPTTCRRCSTASPTTRARTRASSTSTSSRRPATCSIRGATTSSTSTRAGSTPTTCCCANWASTSRTSFAKRG